MPDVNDVLKKVSAALEEATSKFNTKAEEALTEAKNAGQLSASTKDAVDKMALEFNALTAAENPQSGIGRTGAARCPDAIEQGCSSCGINWTASHI